jgi:hypothetical protein
VHPPGGQLQDAARVADDQRPGPLLYRPVHHGPGGFVLGLADTPRMTGLGGPLAAAVLPPPP